MPRLKTLLACAGLSSFTRRAAAPKAELAIEPIRRPFEDDKSEAADSWLFEDDSPRAVHAGALDTLSSSLERLRETLSAMSSHAPIIVEAEPVMPLGAMDFDRDLFDGEPMPAMAGEGRAEALDMYLFEDAGHAIIFDMDANPEALFRQAA